MSAPAVSAPARTRVSLPSSGDAMSGLVPTRAIAALEEVVSGLAARARRAERGRAARKVEKRDPCPERGAALWTAGFPQESDETPFAALPEDRRQALSAAAVYAPHNGYALWARALGKSRPTDKLPENVTPWKDLDEEDQARWKELAQAQRDEFAPDAAGDESEEDEPVSFVIDAEVFRNFAQVALDVIAASQRVKDRKARAD